MKVRVNSNVSIRGEFEPGEVKLVEEDVTLCHLLQELSRRCKTLDLINLESGEKGDNVREVLINGQDFLTLQQLETRLNDGDVVMINIWLDPLGGG